MQKIKRDDEVIVVTGKDKGERGRVVKVLKNDKLLVSGIKKVKKHQKPNPQLGVAGGIIEKESPIHISNVAIYNSNSDKADKVAFKTVDDKKIRVFKSSGEPVDSK